MKQYPKGGLIGKTAGLLRYMAALQIPLYASHACFFIVLAVFPALVLLLCLVRYTGLQVEALAELLEGVLPGALLPAVKKLILNTYQNTSGVIVSLSALTALWSASRGIHGLRTGLNAIYDVAEDRSYLHTRLVSILYTFAFLLVLLLTLALHVFGTTLLHIQPIQNLSVFSFLSEIVDLRFFLLLGVQTLLFTAIFMVLPNKHNRFLQSLPGAVFASFGWLVFSDLFSLYVENFPAYATIFGSVYAVALSMLWLYFCMSIVFFGGALNHYLIVQKKH